MPSMYMPATLPAHMLDSKYELAASGGTSSSGYYGNVAFSPFNHVLVHGGLQRMETRTEDQPFPNTSFSFYFETGGGFYLPSGGHGRLEILGGYGRGERNWGQNVNEFMSDFSFFYRGSNSYHRYFGQINFGGKNYTPLGTNFTMSFVAGLRAGYLSFDDWQYSIDTLQGQNGMVQTPRIVQRPGNPFLIIEPALTAMAGFKNFKFVLQGSIATHSPGTGEEILFSRNFQISLGLQLNLWLDSNHGGIPTNSSF